MPYECRIYATIDTVVGPGHGADEQVFFMGALGWVSLRILQ